MFGEPIDYFNYVNTPDEFKSRNYIKVDDNMVKTFDGFAIKTYFKEVDGKDYQNIVIYLGFDDGTFSYFKSPANSKILGQFCKEYNIIIDRELEGYTYYPVDVPVKIMFKSEKKTSKSTGKPYPVFWVVSN